ncbi:MAG: hypothetical protein QOD99_2608 [Chthoniobacter sp.]|jgi:hypothetical protein|nr:hypothetical protein [Chthoniobacter sp.]
MRVNRSQARSARLIQLPSGRADPQGRRCRGLALRTKIVVAPLGKKGKEAATLARNRPPDTRQRSNAGKPMKLPFTLLALNAEAFLLGVARTSPF